MREIIESISYIFEEQTSLNKITPDNKLITETRNGLPALILKEKTIIKKISLSYEEGNVCLEIILEDSTMIFVNEIYSPNISFFSHVIEGIYQNSYEIGVD